MQKNCQHNSPGCRRGLVDILEDNGIEEENLTRVKSLLYNTKTNEIKRGKKPNEPFLSNNVCPQSLSPRFFTAYLEHALNSSFDIISNDLITTIAVNGNHLNIVMYAKIFHGHIILDKRKTSISCQ